MGKMENPNINLPAIRTWRWWSLGPAGTRPSFERKGSVIDLVDGLCTRKATKPGDKAFALRGILQQVAVSKLLPPKYSRPLEQIYKELTVHVLEVTESLQLLLLAAMNRFLGQPSWVTKWDEEFDSFWVRPSLSLDPWENATPDSQAAWQLQEDNVLLVRGRNLATIRGYFNFRKSLDSYDPSQQGLHLQNIHTLLRLLRTIGWGRYDFRLSFCLEELQTAESAGIGEYEIHRWFSFFEEKDNRSPDEIWSLLRNEGLLSELTGRAGYLFQLRNPYTDKWKARPSRNFLAFTF